jgi:hypothetical protein
MKKNVKTLLLMLAVLVVLGGAAAALLLTGDGTAEEETTSSTSSTAEETVMDRSTREVASIQIENTSGAYTLVPIEEGTETEVSETESSAVSSSTEESTSSETEKDVAFTIEGLETYDVNTVNTSSVARSLLSLSASKNLGEKDNLGDYGLEGTGEAKAVIKYQDGTTDTLVVGSVSAGSTSGRYLLKDGTVYVVSGLDDNLFAERLSFVNTEIYTVVDRVTETVDSEGSASETVQDDILNSLELSGEAFPDTIQIQYGDDGIYRMTKPVSADARTDDFYNIVSALKTLTAEKVAAVGVGAGELSQYGLDAPDAKAVFNMNGEDHTLQVSALQQDGTRYLLADGSDVVYVVSNDLVSAWAETSQLQLRENRIWSREPEDISSLTLTQGEDVTTYTVSRTESEDKSTESITAYDLTVTSSKGGDVTGEDFESFFDSLSHISLLNTEKADTSGTPWLTVSAKLVDSEEEDTLQFYAVEGEERYAVVLNGSYLGLIKASSLTEVVSAMP